MDERISAALDRDLTIDITTTGRKSGQPRRIEIWFKRVDGRTFITGTPGQRDWYANMLAHPQITFHLKESIQVDLPATVRPIVDKVEREQILSAPNMHWYHANATSSDAFLQRAPLVEVLFEE